MYSVRNVNICFVTMKTGVIFTFLTRNVSFSYRTKSQKKRFEEELNERMIQAIDGINAQK